MNKKINTIICFSATIVTMFLGIMVIIGWFIHNNFLREIFPGQVRMKFNVALGFVFSSVVLLLNYFPGKNKIGRYISVVLSVTISLIGLLTLSEYIFGFTLGIDELFMKDELRTTATYYAGRMSPLSAVNFVLIGTGLLLFNKVKTAVYQFYYLSGIAFIALLMLIGFNFIADIPTYIRLAIHVAIGFITLPVAIWFAQPELQRKISFERKLFTGFAAVITLIVVISIFSSYFSARRISTSRLVKHTNSVLSEAGETLSLVKDIESGGRGYIITRDSNYLEYFTVAKENILSHLKNLKELTADNSVQQERVDSLSVLIDQRINFSLQCIQITNEKGFEAARALMAARRGKYYTDEIRKVTAEIQKNENDLLIQRQTENDNSIVSFNRAFLVFLASVFILLVIILFAIRNSISIRKKAEKQSRESEERIQTLFRAAPDAVIVIDDAGKIMKWNSMSETIFGWAADEVFGKPLSEIIIPHRYREAHQKGLKHFLKTGEGPVLGKTIEIHAVNKNNIEFDIALSISPTKVNGKYLFIGFIRDITEKKKTEEQLKESEEKYSTLFNSIDEGFCIIEMIFDEQKKPVDYRFLVINASFERQTGLSNAVGKRMREFAPEHEEHWFEIYGKIALTGESIRFENRAEQLHRWYNVYAFRFGEPQLFQVAILFNDITESKEAGEKLLKFSQELEQKVIERTEELAKSEKLFRVMIEKDADMKTLATADGNVFYASPSLTTILGYENHEFMTIPAFDLIHPGDLPGLMEGVTAIVQTPGKSFYRQQRLKHKNGTWIWCEGTITNMLHEPAVSALVSNFRDITERKQAEEALQESQQLLSAIINNSTAVIYVKDLQGHYLLVNRRFSELFHRSEEAILGRTDYDFFSREDADAFRQMDERTAAADYALTEEESVPQDDGLHTYISVKSTLRTTTGKPYAIFGISTDITDRKKAEESIRLAEANYREIFDKASDAIYVHEIETGKIIEVNQRASAITGYSKEELISSDPKDFITSHPQYTLQHTFNYLQKAAEGKPQLFEWLGKNKDGSYNWLEVNLKKASIAGQDRILAFFREINDRKKAQLEVQQLNEELEQKVINRTMQLEAANKELESFSYSVSHDLRAPLRIIDGYADILVTDFTDKLDAEGNRVLGIIKSNAQRMGQLIDDLLNLSQVGRREAIMHFTDMDKLVRSVVEEQLTYSGGHASINVGKLEPANCDSSLIRQVWINLISNAIKYSGKKERPEIEISSVKNGDTVIYSVKDNGVGFDMRYADKLFGVFQRLHNIKEFEGTGVGLALANRILVRQGGKIWAESEEGKGSTFFFSLPV